MTIKRRHLTMVVVGAAAIVAVVVAWQVGARHEGTPADPANEALVQLGGSRLRSFCFGGS